MYSLFLDDDNETRFPPRGPAPVGRWVIVRSLADACEVVERRGVPDFISFDHDLGPEDKGIHFAHWLIGMDLDEREKDSSNPERMLKDGFRYRVHSENPVGAENIRRLMDNYLKFSRSS